MTISQTPSRILVLGGGFAGLWAAAAAARQLDLQGAGPARADVVLVNRDAWHGIRVRNYEADLSAVRVPLADVLEPIGVRLVVGDVQALDTAARRVAVAGAGGAQPIAYDKLVFALGSQLWRPPLPGLAEHGFDVDTYAGAARLQAHLARQRAEAPTPARRTVVVVGGGLTGIEVASELASTLLAEGWRVVLADPAAAIGAAMGPSAQPVIAEALGALGVEARSGLRASGVSADSINFEGGESIAAATVVWCAGMRAHPLAAPLAEAVGAGCGRDGRVTVDDCLRVPGLAGTYVAGDAACAMLDAPHASVMSCQHGRPMGRYAGHNAACELLGLPPLPLHIPWYVTVLDLGAWGALYMQGWERRVVMRGAAAKRVKQTINRERIVPPLNRDRAEILAAAAPVVQAPPGYGAT